MNKDYSKAFDPTTLRKRVSELEAALRTLIQIHGEVVFDTDEDSELQVRVLEAARAALGDPK